MTLRLRISPCPNDTFMFDALLNGRIDTGGLHFDVEYRDIEALNRGELHVLFLRTAAREPSGLQERILGKDALELIMREDMDPAPELSEVPIERLEGVPMCLLRSDDLWSYNDFLVQECQRSGFTPNVTCHCYDTPMAMQMVLSGFGISFLPRSILSTHPGAPLKAKPVRGLPICSYAVLAWNSAVLSAPCVQRFVEEDLKKLSAR